MFFKTHFDFKEWTLKMMKVTWVFFTFLAMRSKIMNNGELKKVLMIKLRIFIESLKPNIFKKYLSNIIMIRARCLSFYKSIMSMYRQKREKIIRWHPSKTSLNSYILISRNSFLCLFWSNYVRRLPSQLWSATLWVSESYFWQFALVQ